MFCPTGRKCRRKHFKSKILFWNVPLILYSACNLGFMCNDWRDCCIKGGLLARFMFWEPVPVSKGCRNSSGFTDGQSLLASLVSGPGLRGLEQGASATQSRTFRTFARQWRPLTDNLRCPALIGRHRISMNHSLSAMNSARDCSQWAG